MCVPIRKIASARPTSSEHDPPVGRRRQPAQGRGDERRPDRGRAGQAQLSAPLDLGFTPEFLFHRGGTEARGSKAREEMVREVGALPWLSSLCLCVFVANKAVSTKIRIRHREVEKFILLLI